MKLACLTTTVLLIFGYSAAFGQATVSLGFLSHDQKIKYCDFETLTVKGSTASGVHDLQTSCGSERFNGVMVGLKANFATGAGIPVTGPAFALADSSADAQFYGSGYCGCVLFYVTKTTPATPQQLQAGGPFGWALYFTEGGEGALFSFGFLTEQLGSNSANPTATFDGSFN